MKVLLPRAPVEFFDPLNLVRRLPAQSAFGPGPYAGGSMPGRDWCHQMPEKSRMLLCVALTYGAGVCPNANVAAAANPTTNTAHQRSLIGFASAVRAILLVVSA